MPNVNKNINASIYNYGCHRFFNQSSPFFVYVQARNPPTMIIPNVKINANASIIQYFKILFAKKAVIYVNAIPALIIYKMKGLNSPVYNEDNPPNTIAVNINFDKS